MKRGATADAGSVSDLDVGQIEGRPVPSETALHERQDDKLGENEGKQNQ